MNKKKIIIVIIIILCLIIVGILHFWIIPSRYEKECKNRIFRELDEKVEEAKKSVIGIIPENKEKEGISHNGIGSGVIFDKQDNIYYALTAAHVVEDNSTYKVFTINTEFSGEIIKADENVNFEIPDDNYYDSLLEAKIEYISDTADIAIISFETEEELPIMELETNKLKIGDKIIAIGHPEGNRYMTTYGTITSNVKSVTMIGKSKDKKKTDKVMEHNAYINYGNSGGAIISENMKIAGINTGGGFNILGYFSKGFMIPYDIVEENINNWKSTNNDNTSNSLLSWDKEKVTIKVKELLEDNKSAIIEINDKNDNPVSWGIDFSIQKMSEGNNEWYELNSKTKIEWLKTIVSPDENGITEMKIDWSNMYGELDRGTYRIVKRNGFTNIYSEPFNI